MTVTVKEHGRRTQFGSAVTCIYSLDVIYAGSESDRSHVFVNLAVPSLRTHSYAAIKR